MLDAPAAVEAAAVCPEVTATMGLGQAGVGGWLSRLLRPGLLAAAVTAAAGLALPMDWISRLPQVLDKAYRPDILVRWSTLVTDMWSGVIPVTVIDVDDKSFAAWGGRDITPRDKVAQVLGKVRATGARAVILDLDLVADQSVDKELLAVLKDRDARVPVLLARAMTFSPVNGDSCAGPQDLFECRARLERTVYDEALGAPDYAAATGGPGGVMWVSTTMMPDDDDIVRRWRLWEVDCSASARRALPSAVVVAAAMARDWDRWPQVVAGFMDAVAGTVCTGDVTRPVAPERSGVPAWPSNPDRFARIPFPFDGKLRFLSRAPATADGPAAIRFQRLSAADILAQPVSPTVFDRRIVLIGSSHHRSRDSVRTPLGEMPGVVVLANAMAVAPAILDATPAGEGDRRVFAAGLFIVLALIAGQLKALPMAILVASVGSVAVVGLSRSYDYSSIFVVLTNALVLFALWLALESVFDIIARLRRGEGLRAFLRRPPPPAPPAKEAAS